MSTQRVGGCLVVGWGAMMANGWFGGIWTCTFFFSRKVQTKQTNTTQQTQQTKQTRQTRQTDKQDKTRRHWAALGLKTPRSARIAQPTPRNPCRGGPGLTAQRQPDHTDPADWSTQNPARKRRTNKTTTDGRRTDRRTDKQTTTQAPGRRTRLQ